LRPKHLKFYNETTKNPLHVAYGAFFSPVINASQQNDPRSIKWLGKLKLQI
jgi:hypothetical protein